jgi:hypothetical protein
VSNARKRELARAYKERRVRRGVYAIRCAASGEVWVSPSANLDGQHNSAWFQLRLRGHPNKALQARWDAHGEAAFSYEVLAELGDEERSAYALKADLKALADAWRAKLNAPPVTG